MNADQASFDMLYLIASSDGEVDESELDVIKDFIADHYQQSFRQDEELMLLLSMSPQERKERFAEAVRFLKDELDEDNKRLMLDFALSMITADLEVHPHEIDYFNMIGDIWDVDVKEFVREKMGGG